MRIKKVKFVNNIFFDNHMVGEVNIGKCEIKMNDDNVKTIELIKGKEIVWVPLSNVASINFDKTIVNIETDNEDNNEGLKPPRAIMLERRENNLIRSPAAYVGATKQALEDGIMSKPESSVILDKAPCKKCGDLFEPRHHRQKYCSDCKGK